MALTTPMERIAIEAGRMAMALGQRRVGHAIIIACSGGKGIMSRAILDSIRVESGLYELASLVGGDEAPDVTEHAREVLKVAARVVATKGWESA